MQGTDDGSKRQPEDPLVSMVAVSLGHRRDVYRNIYMQLSTSPLYIYIYIILHIYIEYEHVISVNMSRVP